MPGIGSLLHGLMTGMQQAQTNDAKREALKLQKQHLDLQEKMGALQQEHLRNQIVHEQAMRSLGTEYDTAQGAENNLGNVQQENLKSYPSAMGTSPEEFSQMNESRATQPYTYGGTVPGAQQPGPVNAPTRSSKDVLRSLVVENLKQHGFNAASAGALGLGSGLTVADMTPEAVAQKINDYNRALNPNGENLYRPDINAKGQVSVKTNPPQRTAQGEWSGSRQDFIKDYKANNPGATDFQADQAWFKTRQGLSAGVTASNEQGKEEYKVYGRTDFTTGNPMAGPNVSQGQSNGATGTPTPRPTDRPGNQPTPSQKSTYMQRKEQESAATASGHPLEGTDRQAITAMQDTLRVANQLKTEFTPEELNKYTGFLKFPANRLAQIVTGDPKFARFQILTNQAKAAAFGEGGKQLTPFEAGITFGHIPTGTEFSTADFVAKLDNIISQTPGQLDRRLTAAKTPKGQLTTQGLVEAAKPGAYGNNAPATKKKAASLIPLGP